MSSQDTLWKDTVMRAPAVEVIHALNMQPGDLYAGTVEPHAPSRPVQLAAHPFRVTGVEQFTGADERRMVRIQAAGPATRLTTVQVSSFRRSHTCKHTRNGPGNRANPTVRTTRLMTLNPCTLRP